MTELTGDISDRLAREIEAAGGREVSFVAHLGPDGAIADVRPVARGTAAAVLALPGVADRGEMLLHNHPSGIMEPSQSDLHVAAQLHDNGIGFGIINNAATSLYVVVEVPKPRNVEPLDAVAVAGLLGHDGPVARALGEFEDRPSQRDMAAYIADIYNDGGVALLEAGTGVGKSFAYLVPALRWAATNSERTVVSTNTINLQEQLVGKDLPILERAFARAERRPTYALLKGWRNYLCLSRLESARQGQNSLFDESAREELDRIAAWARTTADGSLADLTENPASGVWDEVSAEADLCNRVECPHFTSCFLFEARRRAADADVLVVNHHLLAADLAVRRAQGNWTEAAVLPPYRRLILDEAHHLEDTAANHLGTRVTSTGVMRLLGRLERNGRGIVPALIAELSGFRDDPLNDASIELLQKAVLPEVSGAKTGAQELFALLAERIDETGAQVMRLEESFGDDPIWERGLGVLLENFTTRLRKLRDGVETVVDRLELEEDPDQRSRLVSELRAIVRRLENVMDGILLALRPKHDIPTVRWLERRGAKSRKGFPVALITVPLDLAPILRESLFERVDTVVMTSATLTVNSSYEFLKTRTGLTEPYDMVKIEEVLSSPFDYATQSMLCVPTDLPEPGAGEGEHDVALVTAVQEVAEIADGGMFVLFTSYRQMNRVAELARSHLERRWPLLVQGEDQRDRLLRRFRDAGSAVLLGTDSFWEGVDVPGRSLRVLMIAKLPFRVPTEPVTAARLELLRDQGQDGFMSYQVPQASLKLKQGFGRLIRSVHDFGVVLVMDKRLVTRRYGSIMLGSLPDARRITGPWHDVRREVCGFFEERGVVSAGRI